MSCSSAKRQAAMRTCRASLSSAARASSSTACSRRSACRATPQTRALGLHHQSSFSGGRPATASRPSRKRRCACPSCGARSSLRSPRHLVCLGATPTQRLMATTEGIMKLRGKWYDFARAVPHPAPADAASGLSAAPAGPEAPGLARLPARASKAELHADERQASVPLLHSACVSRC